MTCDRQRHLLIESKSRANSDVITTEPLEKEIIHTRINRERNDSLILPSSAEALVKNSDPDSIKGFELPSLEQAKMKKINSESHMQNKPPDNIMLSKKNESEKNHSRPVVKSRGRGRGRGRGKKRGGGQHIDPKQPKLDVFWKRKVEEGKGGNQ